MHYNLHFFSYLFLDSSSLTISINNSVFQENRAKISGAVMKIYNRLPDELKFNNYLENSAPYGEIFASYPIRLNYSSNNFSLKI